MYKSVTIFAILFFSFFQAVFAVDYYFTAEQDHLLSNPANWSPAYPGTAISENDKIFILEDAFFEEYDLNVAGALCIWNGSTLSGHNAQIKIEASGSLLNYGSVIVREVENVGRIDNGPAAEIRLVQLINMPGAFLQNGIGSTLDISQDFINKGEFQNLNICRAENLINHAKINLLMSSSMYVSHYNTQGKHKILTSERSHFYDRDWAYTQSRRNG